MQIFFIFASLVLKVVQVAAYVTTFFSSSNTQANKFSRQNLFLPLSEQVGFFYETGIIVLFWVIIYSYLQKFFKIGVLKTFANSQDISME